MKTRGKKSDRLLYLMLSAFIAWLGIASHVFAAEARNSLESLDHSTLQGGKVVLRVGFSKPLKAVPAGFTVANPARVALDFPDTASNLGKNTVAVNEGPVKAVNVVQAGERTRMVINLDRAVRYTTRIEDKALIVTLEAGDATAQGPVNATARFAEAQPAASAASHALREVDFRRGKDGEGRVVTTLSDVGAGIDIRAEGGTIVVEFMNTTLPKNLQRRLDVTDFATPVQTVDVFPTGSSTRMIIEPKGNWEYSAYQADTQFILEVKAITEDAQKAAGKPKFSGEKLSLNFQNVEVRQVLQVIADFTGFNIIASDTVTGSLTLRLKDVPWDQALDIIMRSKGLDQRVSGNVIWVAPKDELAAKEKLELESKQQISDLEALETQYHQLSYLRADEAQAILLGQGIVGSGASEKVTCSAQATGVGGQAQAAAPGGAGGGQKILSKRGSANFELKTNTLIVNDTARKQKEIRDLLARIDVPAKQVLIEARVVVATDKFSKQLGARFGVANRGTVGGDFAFGIGGSQSASNAIARTGAGTATPLNSIFDAPTSALTGASIASSGGAIGLTILSLGSGNMLGLELQALEADNRGKVVSNPRVVTANQRPAVILQGQQIPFITTSVSGGVATVTVSFKDAFLCLLVDPQILSNDSIVMNVEVQKDAAGQTVAAGGGSATAIETKRLKTQVRLNNGETAVLGGIYEQTVNDDVAKVPFFGDIPIVGNLFKSTLKEDGKSELLIFLTPRVLKDGITLR